MKRLALTIVTVLLFSLVSTTNASSYTNVSVGEAKAMIDSYASLVVLDVRTLSEYNSGHIRNTKHIPLAQLGGRLDELNVNGEILVYCGSGGRSASASQLLVENGFSYIYNMLGGITAWISAGFPVYIKYPSIQNAVNTATEGDTIYVSLGTYFENIVVSKTISLIGENKISTVIEGYGDGVALTANNSHIEGFTIKNSSLGISVYSSNNSISGNVLINNWNGILLGTYMGKSCGGNRILNNDFLSNEAGINGTTWYSTINSNFFCNNSIGLLFYMSNFSSKNNTINENTFQTNTYRGVGLINSTQNEFYHNNFINNTASADSTNIWDNGCEGNYWSNYNGSDLDGDGVGDTNLPWEGVDNYPLMNFFWNPGDIDHDFDVDLFDVVKAAGIYGSTPLDPNWNPHCDIAEPYGIIDIFDLVMIAGSYGEEYTP